MHKFTLKHPLHCSVDRYWDSFLDEGFTRGMLLDGLGFGSAEIGALTEAGTGRKRRSIKTTPRLELPAAVVRVLGDVLAYHETGTYHVERRRWEFESRMSVMADRLVIGGTIWVDPTGDEACMRTSELWVDARIFGVGRLIERAAESNMKTGFQKAADWMNAQFRGRPSSAAP